MNILMNLYPVQSGGGQQVAINFIQLIAKNNYGHKWFFYVGKNSEIHNIVSKLFDTKFILSLPYSYSGRVFNRKKLKSYMKDNHIDIIYNYAPTLSIKGYPQVVRSVYSNLYYPNIDFWSGYPFLTKFKKKIIDYLRLKGTIVADGLIFENQGMQKQAIKLYKYSPENTIYIAPSVTEFDTSNKNTDYDYLNQVPDFKILYLSSWHLNKNIHKLPDVALNLKKINIHVKFVLSLNPDEFQVKKHLVDEIYKKGVSNFFEFIGKVEARFVHQVLKSVDAIILLSKLECFSSNVIEAYTFNKPLIISDEDWARAACKDAALYVNRNNSISIANGIQTLISNTPSYADYIALGKKRLSEFNTPSNKIRKQVEFLEYIYSRSHE